MLGKDDAVCTFAGRGDSRSRLETASDHGLEKLIMNARRK